MNGAAAANVFPSVSWPESSAGAQKKVDHRQTDESRLIERAKARDEAAFRELVEKYQNKVFSIIYGILRNQNDAEDISQQVFTKIYFSIQNFDSRSSLLTWIYKITTNECYDYLRKKRVRKLVYESDVSEEDTRLMENSEINADRHMPVDDRLAQRQLALKLLEKISPEERNLILLKEVEGLSVQELSGLTGMNENTIKVKLFRARQKLVKASQRIMRSPKSVLTG